MKRTLVMFAIFCCMMIVSCDLIPGASSSSGDEILIEDMVIRGKDFSTDSQDTDSQGMIIDNSGLTLDDSSFKAEYLSPAIEAPFPFNAVVPQWIATLPATSQLRVSLRTSADGVTWQPWTSAEANIDWTLPEDIQTIGDMLIVSSADKTHSWIQYRIALSRNVVLNLPLLEEMRLTFIDSSNGLTTEEMILKQQELDAAAGITTSAVAEGYPKPAVISRAVWCTDPDCIYSDGLEYAPVTHLILHHTVTSGTTESDFGAIMRAIWSYHTYTRGWGDIGYNYLVDLNGVIYEGHNGGDNVVGIHASGANVGSMAVSIIGNFNETTPPEAMMDSVVNMFSWKADQSNINIYESSNTLPNIDWGLPNLMGHRDVYGTTECPGHQAHALIPLIQDRVAANIALEDPHLYVDELSSAFTRSNSNWNTATLGCGNNTHAYYTWSTTTSAESTNWGEWRPTIPANGRYEIEVFAPYCNTGAPETRGAKYTVTHAAGSSTVTIDQNSQVGLWIPLGEFNLNAGSGTAVRLTDLTNTDSDRGIWFDAIRLLPLTQTPTAANLNPASNAWLSSRDVAFNWEIVHPQEVASVTLQVSDSAEFDNLIHTQQLDGPAITTSHTFDNDAKKLFWRVVVNTLTGQSIQSAPTSFGIDTTPPTSSIDSIYWLPFTQTYLLNWSGTDETSGISGYTLSTLTLAEGAWQPWKTNTSTTSGLFNPAEADQNVSFRSQAVDQIGNVEPAKETPDLTTDDAVSLSHAILFPVVLRER